MSIYWILIVFCVGIFLLGNELAKETQPGMYTHKYNNQHVLCFVLSTLFLVVLLGLRNTDIGLDTPIYKHHFYNGYGKQSFSFVFEPDVNDRGYIFLQILFNRMGFSFEAFNFVYALFNISVISYLIYKWSDMPWLSYFLFIAFGFLGLSMTMMRQMTAMSVVILAVMSDKEDGFKSFLKFTLIVLVAYTIHASAIIAFPMWFINRINITKYGTAIIFILIAIAYIFKSPLASLIGGLADVVSDRYEMYGVEETGTMGMLLYLMILVTIIASVYMSDFLTDRRNKTLFLFLCSMLIIFPTTQCGGAVMRVYYYYYIFMVVYIPNMVRGMERKRDRHMLALTLLLYLAVGIREHYYLLSNDTYNIVPYMFFWNS